MKSYRKANSAGFSLIELLLVIGFIAGALVLAFVTYPKVQATNRANVESQHITILSGGIKNLYSTAQNFQTLSNNVLLNAKIVPDDLQVSAGTINNIWGGAITVLPATNPLTYEITYTSVPSSECSKLATSVAANFLKLVINTSSPLFDRTTSGGNVSIDPAAAATSCNSSSANTMVFTGN